MTALDLTAQQLWLPGRGLVPPHIAAAMKAVQDYDPDLSLGRHDQSGEWVILLKRGPMEQPHPVFGLGPELPSREEITRILYQGDVRRHGGKLAVQLQQAGDRRRAAERAEINDQTGVAAEALEWGMRKEGRHPNPRIFVPKGVQ
jgi:hypothetical protein